MKIALVVGHDYADRGAYGSEGISEWKFNDVLINGLKFRGLPKKHTYRTFYRESALKTYSAQMRELHKQIDAWGAELSVEFHFNSFASKKAKGHEVLYCSESGGVYAKKLNASLDQYLPTSNRGAKKITKKDRGGGFCCRGKSKAIIIEPFFAVNQGRFVYSGDLRDPLLDSITDFFKSI